mmetsp:Transcript_8115/g.30494  ORF Transcript_8115/g.30494 Transcript_8115/m.30494 type:complete len:505 (-) Transcript_8115:10-1524(-)
MYKRRVAEAKPFHSQPEPDQRKDHAVAHADEGSLGKQYIREAERAAADLSVFKLHGDDAGKSAAQALQHVGVVGAGTMGSGIAISFLKAGATVTLMDADPGSLARGLKHIRATLDRDVSRERLTPAQLENILQRLASSTDVKDLSASKVVVEAAFENMEVKQEVFRSLSRVCAEDTLMCSNTSTLDIDAIATAVKDPTKFLGMHFFSPANIMRLVEIVVGERTSEETTATVMEMSKLLGKAGVVVGNCDGFVGNRLIQTYSLEASLILDEGLNPPEIDAALTAFGMAMGPFAMSDLAGNDISWRIRKAKNLYDPDQNFADFLCDQGRFGQKTTRGWYKYDEGIGKGRAPIPDAEMHEELARHRERLEGINPEGVTCASDEIAERCLLPLVNEGFRTLEEMIARRASDIDVIYVHGYGFPMSKGGPMHWAVSELGLGDVVSKMDSYRERFQPSADASRRYRYNERWEPCDLLAAAARALPGPTQMGAFEAYLEMKRRGGTAREKA